MNPLFKTQRQLYMGQNYDFEILRTFILYDDGSSADPYVFTYPATDTTRNVTVNFTQMLAQARAGSVTQIHVQDMFQSSDPTAQRLVLMQPIVNTRNQTIGVLGLQFDSFKIVKDITETKMLNKEFNFNEVRIYTTDSPDKLIYAMDMKSGKPQILDREYPQFSTLTEGNAFAKEYPDDEN